MNKDGVWEMAKDILFGMSEHDLEDAFGVGADTSTIFDMTYREASEKYCKWREQADNYKKPLQRGDVVIVDDTYYVILGFWGDLRHAVDALSADGRISSIRKELIEDKDMHVSLEHVAFRDIERFLQTMQKRYDQRAKDERPIS